MRLVVSTEARFLRTPDGAIHAADGVNDYAFWRRYLDVFDEVVVAARVFDASDPGGTPLVCGPGVSVQALPGYRNIPEFLIGLSGLLRSLDLAARARAAFLLRLPGPIGGLLARDLWLRRKSYGVEVVGDPREVFAPGVVEHPLRPALRRWFAHDLTACCRRASAVAYVSRAVLPERYPAAPGAPVAFYSSIDLPDEAFVSEPRTYASPLHAPRVIAVGSLAQRYKGIDTLIEALALCRRRGIAARLEVVGDGRHRRALAALAERLGMSDRVTFRGAIAAGEPVRRALDAADVFALPSRTEGLPRAAIEAMARALPVLGSTVGGFAELLPADDAVPPDDPRALAEAIERAVQSSARLTAMSARNLATSRRYHRDELTARRHAFYHALAASTPHA